MRTSLQPFNLVFMLLAACGPEDLATVESSAPISTTVAIEFNAPIYGR